MEKSEKITLLATIVLVGFTFGVFLYYVLGFYLKVGDPYRTFLSPSWYVFGDFRVTIDLIKNFAPYDAPDVWMNYFPLAYILLFPFLKIKSFPIAYIIYSSIFVIPFIWINIKLLNCQNLPKIQNFNNIFIISFLSCPFLLLLDVGNLDIILMSLICGFIYLFSKKKFFLSAILLAITNAIKPFFLIFLILFLVKKRWKEALLSFAFSCLLIIGGFMVLKGSFWNQISIYIINLFLFKQTYILGLNNVLNNNTSLFALLKLIFCASTNLISVSSLLKIYNIFVFLVSIVVSVFTWREKVFWKQTALLIAYLLVIPHVIFNYKLIFLFIPLWLFIISEKKSRFDLAYSIIFGLLLIPKKFLPVFYSSKIFFLHLGSILDPLLLLTLMGLIIFEQIVTQKSQISEEN